MWQLLARLLVWWLSLLRRVASFILLSLVEKIQEQPATPLQPLAAATAATGTPAEQGLQRLQELLPTTHQHQQSADGGVGGTAGSRDLSTEMLQEFLEVSREVSVERTLARARAAVLRLLRVQRATVLLVDEPAGVLRLIMSSDANSEAVPLDAGIAGAVVRTGKSVVIADAYSDERFDRSVDHRTGFRTRGVLAVPVFAQDEQRVVAVLEALNKEDGYNTDFNETDVILLEVLASLVSGLVTRTALFEVSKRERARAEAMLMCASALHSSELPARSKALRATEAVEIGAECERASLFVVDAVAEQLFLISHDQSFGMRLPLSAGVAGECATTGDVVRVSDAYSDTRFERSIDHTTGFVTRSILAVPIRIGSRVVGVLEALNHTGEDGFHAAHVELLHAVAMQVAELLLPQLLEAIASSADGLGDPSGPDGEEEDPEISALRTWLMAEYSHDAADAEYPPSPRAGATSASSGRSSANGSDHGSANGTRGASRGSSPRLEGECSHERSGSHKRSDGTGSSKEESFEWPPDLVSASAPLQRPGMLRRSSQSWGHGERGDVSGGGSSRDSRSPSWRVDAPAAVVEDRREQEAAAEEAGEKPMRTEAMEKEQAVFERSVSSEGSYSQSSSRSSPLMRVLRRSHESVIYNRVLHAQQQQQQQQQQNPNVRVPLKMRPPPLQRLLVAPKGLSTELLQSWSLNVWGYTESELPALLYAIFEMSGVREAFRIDGAKLGNFLTNVCDTYRPNPYHNAHHAAQVCHVALLLARSGVGTEQRPLEPLDLLALLTAAVGHDLDHPGTNNAFLVASNSPLAILYNDESVLENHHAATTFRILSRPGNDFLSALEPESRRQARRLIIRAILATDMACHATHVKELTEVVAETRGIESTLLVQTLLHLADLSNVVQPFSISKRWARCVVSEFQAQATKESKLGLPPTQAYLALNTEEDVAKLQLGFIDVVCSPLWRTAALLLPGAKARVEVLDTNRAAWAELRSALSTRASMLDLSSRSAAESPSPEGKEERGGKEGGAGKEAEEAKEEHAGPEEDGKKEEATATLSFAPAASSPVPMPIAAFARARFSETDDDDNDDDDSTVGRRSKPPRLSPSGRQSSSLIRGSPSAFVGEVLLEAPAPSPTSLELESHGHGGHDAANAPRLPSTSPGFMRRSQTVSMGRPPSKSSSPLMGGVCGQADSLAGHSCGRSRDASLGSSRPPSKQISPKLGVWAPSLGGGHPSPSLGATRFHHYYPASIYSAPSTRGQNASPEPARSLSKPSVSADSVPSFALPPPSTKETHQSPQLPSLRQHAQQQQQQVLKGETASTAVASKGRAAGAGAAAAAAAGGGALWGDTEDSTTSSPLTSASAASTQQSGYEARKPWEAHPSSS